MYINFSDSIKIKENLNEQKIISFKEFLEDIEF